MSRKVIQITESGIFLCDDGTMWERFTPIGEIGRGGFPKVMKSKWIQIEDIPQDNEIYNDPDRLAPLGTPIVVLVDGEEIEVIRTKFIDEHGFMEYKLNDGQLMTGRFMWRYV
jgi:hypothetical protein